jgi:hypothetical protein
MMMVSSSSDCERESSFVGVKNEETEGNFKDISHSLLGVDARAHTHTHTFIISENFTSCTATIHDARDDEVNEIYHCRRNHRNYREEDKMKTHHHDDEKKLETLAEMMHLMKEIHEQRARETDERIKDIAEKWKRGSEERDVIAEKRYEETLSKLDALWEGMSVKLLHRLNDYEERLEALERARSAPPPPRGGGGQENDDGDATAEKSNRKIKRIQQQQHEQQQNSIADRRRRLDNMYAKLEDLKG